MATVTDPTIPSPFLLVSFAESEFETWLRHRQECGGDRWDEVWDGVYVVMPMGNIQHQELITRLSSAFIGAFIDTPGARVFAGCNVSDDPREWTKNYRCPDVAVYLHGNPAEDREAYWFGGPRFRGRDRKHERSFSREARLLRQGRRPRIVVHRPPSLLVSGAISPRGRGLGLGGPGDARVGREPRQRRPSGRLPSDRVPAPTSHRSHPARHRAALARLNRSPIPPHRRPPKIG